MMIGRRWIVRRREGRRETGTGCIYLDEEVREFLVYPPNETEQIYSMPHLLTRVPDKIGTCKPRLK
jgi:hypothetical protein